MSAAEPTNIEVIKTDASTDHDVELTPFTIFRYVASIALLIFSIIIVGALIFTGNTKVASETSPAVAVIVCVSRTLLCMHDFCMIIFDYSAP